MKWWSKAEGSGVNGGLEDGRIEKQVDAKAAARGIAEVALMVAESRAIHNCCSRSSLYPPVQGSQGDANLSKTGRPELVSIKHPEQLTFRDGAGFDIDSDVQMSRCVC